MICAMPVILPIDDETMGRPYCGKEGAVHELNISNYLRGTGVRLICTDCAQWMITMGRSGELKNADFVSVAAVIEQ